MLSAIYTAKRHSEEGFTLLELLIVVIVIGILAAIALPIFLNQQRAAIDASVKSDVRNTVAEVNAWAAEHRGASALSTAAYLATDGKVTKTDNGNVIDLQIATDGSYAVCGYNPKGGQFTASTRAWGFDADTGHFKQLAAGDSCAAGWQGSSSGTSTGTGSSSATENVVTSWNMEGTPPTGLGAYPFRASLIEVADAHSPSHVYAMQANTFSELDYAFNASNFQAGKTYTLSIWARTTNGGTVQANVNDGQTNDTKSVTIGDTWTRVTRTYTPPASGPTSMYYSLSTNSSPASIQLDDVQLIQN